MQLLRIFNLSLWLDCELFSLARFLNKIYSYQQLWQGVRIVERHHLSFCFCCCTVSTCCHSSTVFGRCWSLFTTMRISRSKLCCSTIGPADIVL